MRILALSLALMATPVAAHDFTLGDLTIGHPMAFATPPMAKAGGGYLTITNGGSEPDALIDLRSELPRTELHRSFEDAGVMKMERVERLEIPAGGSVELAPGGHHIMFMGLGAPFAAGDTLPLTLVFERAGEIEVIVNVEARTEPQDHGH